MGPIKPEGQEGTWKVRNQLCPVVDKLPRALCYSKKMQCPPQPPVLCCYGDGVRMDTLLGLSSLCPPPCEHSEHQFSLFTLWSTVVLYGFLRADSAALSFSSEFWAMFLRTKLVVHERFAQVICEDTPDPKLTAFVVLLSPLGTHILPGWIWS